MKEQAWTAAHDRELIVIQDTPDCCYERVRHLSESLVGDWLVLSYHPCLPGQSTSIHPLKAKQLLGREFQHAIFDATQGFNLDALAILSGTLRAGSYLVLLLPQKLTDHLDCDSLRWIESEHMIACPHFYRHLITTLADLGYPCSATDSVAKPHRQKGQMTWPAPLPIRSLSQSAEQVLKPSPAQQDVLTQLLTKPQRVNILTAKRGRGKSTLAGFMTQSVRCWLTAPQKVATLSFDKVALRETPFYAPDALLLMLAQTKEQALPDWLLIDEAAAIPVPLLQAIIHLFPKQILLTSTIEGYEGTGQGVLLKLLPQLSDYQSYSLDEPLRWGNNDSLEKLLDSVLITAPTIGVASCAMTESSKGVTPIYQTISQTELLEQHLLEPTYTLLRQAHYRTTTTDLRRLLDAPNIVITLALVTEHQHQSVVGVCLAIKEGGLADDLATAIWQGLRRPKGNLVAQSLTAHAGESDAARLGSLRINRIVVDPAYRRQAIARHLIEHNQHVAQLRGYDFLSVSYSYQSELAQFWQQVDFTPVHVGSHRESSSGSYCVMALRGLTEPGRQLQLKLSKKLSRNWFWLRQRIELELPIIVDSNQQFSLADLHELMGFSFYYRAFDSSYAALARLLSALKPTSMTMLAQHAPLLLALLNERYHEKEVIAMYRLNGKHDLLTKLRLEVQHLLTSHFLGTVITESLT